MQFVPRKNSRNAQINAREKKTKKYGGRRKNECRKICKSDFESALFSLLTSSFSSSSSTLAMFGSGESSSWTSAPPVYTTTMATMPHFTGFDPGTPASSGLSHQTPLFHFPGYSSVPVPFDYPQVIKFCRLKTFCLVMFRDSLKFILRFI